MFGKNEIKVCYAEPGLEGGEGEFTKYEGTAVSSSTALPLWLLLWLLLVRCLSWYEPESSGTNLTRGTTRVHTSLKRLMSCPTQADC